MYSGGTRIDSWRDAGYPDLHTDSLYITLTIYYSLFKFLFITVVNPQFGCGLVRSSKELLGSVISLTDCEMD